MSPVEQVLYHPVTCGITYLVLLAFGAVYFKRYYADHENASLLMGLLYIAIFGAFIAQLMAFIKNDLMNFPLIVIAAMPVASLFAVFCSNFFTQMMTVKEYFQKHRYSDSASHVEAAMRHLHNQNYREAIDSYRKLLKAHPDDFQIYLEIAEIYAVNLHEHQKAVEEFGKAAEKAGKDPIAISIYNRMADLYFSKLDLPDRAVECLKSIVRKWPGSEASQIASERITGIEGSF
ncbi:MAG: tetratricopeptide repeat protein [Candidatus Eremiobacteraeota bacterium]|nr:tetratricopeptide repeat protein [Candidatus Eremiobacteraeota bacterium]